MGVHVATGRITSDAYYDKIKKHWFYQINIPASLTPDGRRRREKGRSSPRGVNFRTKGEALEAMDRRLREIRAWKIDFSGRMTLAEFVEAWAEHQRDEIPDERIAKYQYTVETYVIPWLGTVRLGDVADRLKVHYRFLRTEGMHRSCCHRNRARAERGDVTRCREGRPLSASTTAQVHKVLRSMLGLAVELDLFPIHPMIKIKPPAFKHKEFTPWSAAEVHRGTDLFAAERLGLAWIVAMMGGLRRGELAGLRWRDVDLDARLIHVVNQRAYVHTESGTKIVDREPKGTLRRSIPMSGVVVTLLTEHRKRQRIEGLKHGYGSPIYVFVNELGERYSPAVIYNRFQTACRRYGLPVVRLHDLRHTFATLLFSEKIDPKIIQKLLGHSSDRLTREIYIHYLPEMGAEAVAALDKKIGKSA
ncbi:tyrosine-type recombinase/integrase [Candidatus Frankia alpina]|uniref:tyrosine-type recombinase/integrase n=1 Tax=Candidatus Frankia alpina TaxID=2699483 RepID=UPI0013D05F58|nr:site-specific integrase [Candidatus Frankia alpina]